MIVNRVRPPKRITASRHQFKFSLLIWAISLVGQMAAPIALAADESHTDHSNADQPSRAIERSARPAATSATPRPTVNAARPSGTPRPSAPRPAASAGQQAGAQQPARRATPRPAATPRIETPAQTLERLRGPLTELQQLEQNLTGRLEALHLAQVDDLEGMANSAFLGQILTQVFNEARRRNWRQSERFRIFPVSSLYTEELNSRPSLFAQGRPVNQESLRVGIMGLTVGSTQRGLMLTASYQGGDANEIKAYLRTRKISDLLVESEREFQAFAVDLVDRFRDGNNRISRYLPVAGDTATWVLGCETLLAGRFCIQARVFDAKDTSLNVFIDALLGETASPQNQLIQSIRETNLRWPIDSTWISRGYRVCGCTGQHYGLDLASPIGTIVRSVQDGVVSRVANLPGWGRSVVIEHTLPDGRKYISLYAHLSRFAKGLRAGQNVRKGEIVALVGNSGRSSGPHLHLEIRPLIEGRDPLLLPSRDNRPIDPMRVLNLLHLFVDTSPDAVNAL